MGDDLFLRSHCPGGAGCFCDGAEHVYLRERTVTPPRTGLRSSRSRRTSNRGHGVETVTISKTNSQSATFSASSTASVEVTSMVTRRSARAGSAQPAAPAAPAGGGGGRRSERLRAGSTTGSERRVSSEYLAYSSDDEFEEFISQPKTDYTYARSVSYNTISPQHVTPPNMSRRCLHSPGDTTRLATNTGGRDDRLDLSLTGDVRDFSYSRQMAPRVRSSAVAAAATGKGSLYHISRGLDVDSGDEDYVENNNVSKSSLYKSRTITQDTKITRRTISSVLVTLLYPFTYLWVAASGAGRRLIWRERTDTSTTAGPAAPPPGSVEYHRLMRGLPRLAEAAGSQRPGSRPGGQLTAAARRSTVTTITSTVSTVLTSVLTLLWWPVQQTVAAGRRSACWARSVGEAADLPGRSAVLLHCLSPRTWARAAGDALGSLSPSRRLTSAVAAEGSSAAHRRPGPVSWLRSAWLAVLSTVQWTATTAAQAVTGTARGAAGALGSAVGGTAGVISDAAFGTVGVVSGAAKGTAGTLGGAASGMAGAFGGAARGTAGAIGSVASGTVGAIGSVASGTVGAIGSVASGTVGAVGSVASDTVGVVGSVAGGTVGVVGSVAGGTVGAVGSVGSGVISSLAAAASRLWSSVWPWAGSSAGRHDALLASEKAGRRRRLCLCLLPLLLLLLLLLLALLIPLWWGLHCEEDPVAAGREDRQQSAVLRQLSAAPAAAWLALRDTAAFVGTSTVYTASSIYGYLSLLGTSALLAAPTAAPGSTSRPAPEVAAPAAAPVVAPVVPAVPVVPAAVPSESLTAVYSRLEELQSKMAALQTDFQSCRAASEAAGQPAAVRAALGLGAGQLLTAEQLAAAERRQTEQLAAQLAAVQQQLERSGSEQQAAQAARRTELEARLVQLESAAGQLQQLQDDSGRADQRAAGLTGELTRLQQDFSDLHRTLLAVQENLKQVRSCCNRTDPDWSALLSQRLQSLESDLEGRLQGFAATIKEDLATESVSAAAVAAAGSGGLSREDVLLIARETLAQYDADKTGKFDYALESAGGSVVSTKCTESYSVRSARISVLGIPLWYPSNNPRTIIQPSVSPGECYAFRGQGYFVLGLSRRIEPTEFVMEHISRNLTPTAAIDSAPRNFTVLGLRDGSDQDGVVLGRYVYRESGPPLQEFTARPAASAAGAAFSVVELRVHDNWGHRDYTCLYRFRVHGRPEAANSDTDSAVVREGS